MDAQELCPVCGRGRLERQVGGDDRFDVCNACGTEQATESLINDAVLRRLLELAAKAAGYAVIRRHHFSGLMLHSDGCKSGVYWNPADDDGDSRRLQVALDIIVHPCRHANGQFECLAARNGFEWSAAAGEPAEATRRAVLLAAAEVGKAMQPDA